MRKSGLTTVFVGLVLAVAVLAAVVSCNKSSGETYYYPQDAQHGYYDTHHHYHYYPKYRKGSKFYVVPKRGAPGVKVKPAPKSGGHYKVGGTSKGGGFKSGSRKR